MENKLERLYEAIVAVGNDIEYHAKEWKLYNALYDAFEELEKVLKEAE